MKFKVLQNNLRNILWVHARSRVAAGPPWQLSHAVS